MNEEVKSEIIFENLHVDSIPATLDIGVWELPCEIIDLQYRNNNKYDDKIAKYHVLQSGEVSLMEKRRPVNEVYDAYKKGEGCRFQGTIHLNFLANSFMIGFSNIRFLQYCIEKDGKTPALKFDHHINSLTFGPDLMSLATQFESVLD